MPRRFQIKENDYEISLWYLSESPEELAKKTHLSEKEASRLDSIVLEKMKASFLAIRHMSQLDGHGEIRYLPNGKPRVERGHISISHSGNWLAMMYSEKKDVGIDVEQINDRILKIKNRFLMPEEIELVCGGRTPEMILCWSAKEAVFKKYGSKTVFFKENQTVKHIDKENNKIRVLFRTDLMEKEEILSYSNPEKDYYLVHTM